MLSPLCQELQRAEPRDIPVILPKLLNFIRMIWTISRYYTSEERLTGLLRKVSNEVIRRCCAVISLDDIFEGDVQARTPCGDMDRPKGPTDAERRRTTDRPTDGPSFRWLSAGGSAA